VQHFELGANTRSIDERKTTSYGMLCIAVNIARTLQGHSVLILFLYCAAHIWDVLVTDRDLQKYVTTSITVTLTL